MELQGIISTSDLLSSKLLKNTPIGLYVHIPFCKKKCGYCDFFSIPITGSVPKEYIEAVKSELGENEYGIPVKSIYFGGGSPSLLKPTQIEHILDSIKYSFSLCGEIEVTVEINPEDVNFEWLSDIKKLGVNRISVGVQSFSDRELEYLGRRHNSSKAKLICEWVGKIFDNWSLDLIYGVRGGTIDDWNENLRTALRFNPPHISTYCLTIEETTPLWRVEGAHEVDEELNLKLYKLTHKVLTFEGYSHYEISNFSKRNKKCRHNLIYWRNEPYIGLGAGAYSFVPPYRCGNPKELDAYISAPGKKSEIDSLNIDIIKKETLLQHFRLKSGISERYYYDRFGSSIWEDFGEKLNKLRKNKLVSVRNGTIFPTMRGFYLNNEIGLEIL
ncbi:MAG: radical SAM family heme chaperone HemW [Candidatus Hydrogenedentes bacterium]|nr:radical SAM family heme chaperone HemW [Candidatus Hydrogenedentota bacterium]